MPWTSRSKLPAADSVLSWATRRTCASSPVFRGNSTCHVRKSLLSFRSRPASHSKRQLKVRAVLQGVRLPGLFSSPTPVYTEEEALRAAVDSVPPITKRLHRAFYSSELNGIVRDPHLMTVPVDDRLFLHGHGAFEMCHISQGYIYLFEEHLERFLWSVSKAGLRLPMPESELKKIVLHTAAAGNKLNGFVRFWLSGGCTAPGVSVKGGKGPALYVLASCEKPYQDYSLEKGFKAKTSRIPVHDTYYTGMQSNSNLPAVLSQLDAEQEGLDVGVLVDEEMNVIKAGDYDISIITANNTLVVVPDEESLSGVMLNRIQELLSASDDPSMTVKSVEKRLFSVEEAVHAAEVFVTHPHLPVMGVVEWDGVEIGDGTSGINTAGFSEMVVDDADPRENSYLHTEIPYGFMTMDNPKQK